jgi:hypothetical protein
VDPPAFDKSVKDESKCQIVDLFLHPLKGLALDDNIPDIATCADILRIERRVQALAPGQDEIAGDDFAGFLELLQRLGLITDLHHVGQRRDSFRHFAAIQDLTR